MEKELYFTADKYYGVKIFFRSLLATIFFYVVFFGGGMAIFSEITGKEFEWEWFFGIFIASLVLFAIVFTVHVNKRLNLLDRAFVSINERKIFIRTPEGRYHTLDATENDLRQDFVRLDRFFTKGSYLVYALVFTVRGQEIELPMNWLSQKHRHQIFSRIAYLRSEEMEFLESDSPLQFEVFREKVIRQIAIKRIIVLLLVGVMAFVILFLRSFLFVPMDISKNIFDVIIVFIIALITFKPIIDILALPTIWSRIPTRVEINERGIRFDEDEILYRDMLNVTINAFEKKSIYSIRISTKNRNYRYPLGMGGPSFLELIRNKKVEMHNRNITFSEMLKAKTLKNGVDYYIM